jgi:RNA polymerase sigma factor (sigma-70 family)
MVVPEPRPRCRARIAIRLHPCVPTMSVVSGRFPATRYSLVAAVRGGDRDARERALDTLIAAYWRPVFTHLRLRWHAEHEDAKDLTQEFFVRLLERGLLERYDPARSRLRSYLRLCLDAFAANERKAAGRLKRGGGTRLLSLDFAGAEAALSDARQLRDDADIERRFHREWVRGLFTLALDALRAQCEASGKMVQFALFERYDLDGAGAGGPDSPTYAQLAAEHGLAVTQVTNYLSFARREFRRIVLERLREISGSDDEFRAEARSLLGVEDA